MACSWVANIHLACTRRISALLRLQPGAVDVFLDFISYSGGPLPEELLPQVGCPVSILWGEADPWEPIAKGRVYGDFDCVEEFIPLPGMLPPLLCGSTPFMPCMLPRPRAACRCGPLPHGRGARGGQPAHAGIHREALCTEARGAVDSSILRVLLSMLALQHTSVRAMHGSSRQASFVFLQISFSWFKHSRSCQTDCATPASAAGAHDPRAAMLFQLDQWRWFACAA